MPVDYLRGFAIRACVRGRSFMLHFQIVVLESFASMIEALLTMPTATMLTSKNAEPTIIMMEPAENGLRSAAADAMP